ncbi:hypothetical protein N7532_002053 [Penicillium argentinense]|uniref:C3H1-type domain-containing protein n=1 Tax=Penicillium argentinense TaxID=1131581 RepID=A0A9W9G3U1_9EURO|nr:uncharacterized protein N7532_002053 [Penicillium argentinense]KAJ5111518.1 hypothetical protein N7532_002053 [Penicillium argentinense]
MEQSSAQHPMSGGSHAAPGQGQLPPGYWNGLDALFPESQLQPGQGQDPSTQQTPMGISWDHPIFQQQQQQQQQNQQPPQSQNPLQPQTQSNHGIYSAIPQTWQQNPLHQAPASYAIPSQFQPHQQLPQYPHDQMAFDSRPLTPSESSAFPTYTYQQNYYHPQQLAVQEPLIERSTQHQQPTEFSTTAPRSSISQFHLPSPYQTELPTIDLTNDFPHAESHQTINPQFLSPTAPTPNQPQQQQQQRQQRQQHVPNNFSYAVPAEFQGADGTMFNYYQNDFSVQPQGIPSNLGMPQIAARGHSTPAGFPAPPDVVITNTTKPAAKNKPKAKKPTAKVKNAQTKSDSDSSDQSDSEIEAPDEPSPIPSTRSNDPVEGAKYDTMKAVWSPRNKRPTPDKVKSALVAFPKIIKTLRDAWKDQVQAMKLAENQGDNDKFTVLKKDVALQRQVMDSIVRTALDMGHPMIVEKLGEHPMAVIPIYSFLAERFQSVDYDGSLTVNLLKLLERFVTVDEDLLQKTNLSKILPKFVKKGGPVTKELAQKILENASASTKRKQNNAKTGKEDPPALKAPLRDSPSADVAGTKRARDGDSNTHPATKRMVVAPNAKEASKAGPASNGPAKSGPNGKAAATAAPRPRTNIVAPKPSSLFGTLSSASKRPGTTNAERAAAAAAAKSTPSAEKKEKPAAPPKSTFSFGDIMADLSKPKDAPSTKTTEEKTPETEEEREKRVRKESRRKLRVTWKPDDCLVETRLFTHDPDEELGPGDSSLRGVGDVKGEGSVLKLHKDLEELEEDDLGGIRETNINDYPIPTLIDIVYENGQTKAGNFVKRGGDQMPFSPEEEAQKHREATTLMTYYNSPADVPPTPKEPSAPESGTEEAAPELVFFGESAEDFVKARQERYYAHVNPKLTVAPAPLSQPATAPGGFDISNLLKLINPALQQQQQSTPPPQPQPTPPQAPASELERTIGKFRQQQSQTQPPPPPPAPVSQPTATQEIDFQKIFNVMQQMQGSTFPQAPQSQAGMAPNLGAMFGQQFGGQNQMPNHNSSYGQSYEDPERKRIRETSQSEEWSRQKRTKAGGPMPYKVGVVPCKFWAEGKCRKGDNCTFRHDPQ